jgi:hypothetical protein
MLSSPSRYLVLFLLGAMIALSLHAQEKPSKSSPPVKSGEKDKKAAPAVEAKKPADLKKLDLATLPADAVLVLCERANEALELFPKLVILRPEKYQEMRDEIERLKEQLQSEKQTATPTRCLLRGKVEANAVRLEAEFSGTTDRPNAWVTLACPQAGASVAETDGGKAQIRRSESSGFAVRIDKAGDYRIKLDLILPLATRDSSTRGFELTLPRPVITNLELDLPANVKDVRVGGRTLKDPRLVGLSLKNNWRLQGNPSLEPVEKLDVSWKEVRRPVGEPMRTAVGSIQVRLDESGLTTEVDLVLSVEGAPANEWRLLVPPEAEIKVDSQDDSRVQEIRTVPDTPFSTQRIIRLKEASADPLHVHIRVPPQPHPTSPMPVGPFFVLDAIRQRGTVVVRNRTRNVQLDYRGHGDMQLRRQQPAEIGETPGTVATLEYSDIPKVAKPKEATGPNSLSWLDLVADTSLPQMRTRVLHILTLRPSNNEGDMHWDIATTISPATKWSDGEPLKILVPEQWQSSGENLSVNNGKGESRFVSLPIPRDASSPSLRLEGRYPASQKKEGRAVLKLPRPTGTIESCEVKIEAPSEIELVVNNGEMLNLELGKPNRPNEQSWRCRGGVPEGVGLDISWRPYRPELRVSSIVDLALNGKHGDVRHELRLQLPPLLPASLSLRVPPEIDEVRVESGEWKIEKKNGVYLLSPLAATQTSPAKPLVLQYTTSLVEKSGASGSNSSPYLVPLATVEQATAGDVKVRIWSEPGELPRLATSRLWEELGSEEVEGRRDLPALVLRATRRDAPLQLIVAEQTTSYTVLVERALMRISLAENGVQYWRARYQIRQLAQRDLDIAFSVPVATLRAHFVLNGKQVTPALLDEKGQSTDGGNVARLRLSPELVRRAALLEVSFQTLPGRSERSPLHTLLQPPILRGAPSVPARWLVSVSNNRVLLAPESGTGAERTWTRCGWLLAARLQRSCADLEREFDNALPDKLRQELDSRSSGSGEETAPTLMFWQDQAAPIVLTEAPQQAWLLACSLAVLLLGLGLYGIARPRADQNGRWSFWIWPLLALVTLTVAVAALFWPTAFWAVVYGCEPGALVLLGVLALQWMMHRRYRRQIVFLPSFSRSRAGSSLVRKSSVPRVSSGEPSTVDAPPPVL